MNEREQSALESEIINIIVHSGNCRSLCMEAISCAKKMDFDEATQKIKFAENESLRAHQAQTALIQREASGDLISPTLLIIHAQDHLMCALTVRDLAKEIIDLYRGMHGCTT